MKCKICQKDCDSTMINGICLECFQGQNTLPKWKPEYINIDRCLHDECPYKQETAWEMFRRLNEKYIPGFLYKMSDKLKCDDDLQMAWYILLEEEQKAIDIMQEIEKELENGITII